MGKKERKRYRGQRDRDGGPKGLTWTPRQAKPEAFGPRISEEVRLLKEFQEEVPLASGFNIPELIPNTFSPSTLDQARRQRDEAFARLEGTAGKWMSLAQKAMSWRLHWVASRVAHFVARRYGPAESVVLVWAGQRLALMGRVEEALDMYRRQTGTEPNAESFYTLGAYVRSMGRAGEAVPFLLRACQASPTGEGRLPMFELLVMSLGEMWPGPFLRSWRTGRYYREALDIGSDFIDQDPEEEEFKTLTRELVSLPNRHRVDSDMRDRDPSS